MNLNSNTPGMMDSVGDKGRQGRFTCFEDEDRYEVSQVTS